LYGVLSVGKRRGDDGDAAAEAASAAEELPAAEQEEAAAAAAGSAGNRLVGVRPSDASPRDAMGVPRIEQRTERIGICAGGRESGCEG
jgi:hypothetical protein